MNDIDRDILLNWARAELENWKEGTKLWAKIHPNHCSGSEHKGAMWEGIIKLLEEHDRRVTELLNYNNTKVQEVRDLKAEVKRLEGMLISRGYDTK